MQMRARIPGVVVIGILVAAAAEAQPIGTFSWQQAPYCNVLTLNVVQAGSIYHLDGTDNQCGAARKASVTGVGFLNPDSTIGLGLSVVTNNGAAAGGAPLHLDITLTLATVSGTWRDNTGQTGAWNFLSGAPAAGAPRPAPVPVFPGGLAAGGAPVTGVGTPVAGTDAANKTYVDGTTAAVKAQLFPLVVLSGYVNSNGSKDGSGPFTSSRSGVGSYSISYNFTGLNVPGSFMPLVITATPSFFCAAGGTARADWTSYAGTSPASTIGLAVQITNGANALADCDFSFLAAFQPSATLPPAATAAAVADRAEGLTCWNTPSGAVCR